MSRSSFMERKNKMADTTIEFEIEYLKGEIKSMHSIGLIVPSSIYERLHRLEKEERKRKRDVEEIEK